MKILVDASLSLVQSWLTLIPINIKLDKHDLIDVNQQEHQGLILSSPIKQTSFLSPSRVQNLLDDKQVNIIFTIPKALSGQYQAYQILANEKTLVVEGTAFFTHANQIKKILEQSSDLQEIKKKITLLNHSIKFDGLILDLENLPHKGRLGHLVLGLLNKFKIKPWLKFYNCKWHKFKLTRNVFKTLKAIAFNKKNLTIVAYDHNIIKQQLQKLTAFRPALKIKFIKMSNSMLVHSGKSFVAFY